MKRFLCWSAAVLILLAIPYAGLWIYTYQWFEKEIDRAYSQADERGYQFLGPKPVLTGFPFVPEVFYSGGFQSGNIRIEFAEARLRGYPIPGLTFHLDIPRGLSLGGIADPSIWFIDTLESDIVIPSTIPGDIDYASLNAWHQNGGQFDIRHYKMTKGAMQSEGQGKLMLDDSLQPVIEFENNLRGYEQFIEMLLDEGVIKPFPAAAAKGILASLSKPDEITGENVVGLKISIQNQILSIGPLQLVQFPAIVWPGTHRQPAPLQ